MDKIQIHGDVLWFQNVKKYDHKTQGFDLINDPLLNRTLHIIYNNRNDIKDFTWVLPRPTEEQEKFLKYININLLNGVISFKFIDEKYYGTTLVSNIEKFVSEFSMMDFDDVYNDAEIVVSEFPIDFGEHVLYILPDTENIKYEDSSSIDDAITSVVNVYYDFICYNHPKSVYNKELFDGIHEYFLSKGLDKQTESLKSILENGEYKILLWDEPMEHDVIQLKTAVIDKNFIEQFNMILCTNTSNVNEAILLDAVGDAIRGVKLPKSMSMVVLDKSDDIDKNVLRSFLAHYGTQVGIYTIDGEITHYKALYSLISPISDISINNMKEYIV